MSNILHLDTQDERYHEASLWIAKMDSGLSHVEKKLLQKWLCESSNRDVLYAMTKLWDKMDSLSRLADIFPSTVPQQQNDWTKRFALAASLALAVLIGVWSVVELRPNPDSPIAAIETTTTVYETAVGEQSTITLSDGTQVTLNTNSLVEVNYTSQNRLLRLERGELHVRVAHDSSRPLSVLANDTVVQAVGTEFNVEITSDQRIELVVTDGRVIVGILESDDPQDPADKPMLLLEESLLTVSAGQEIVLGGAEAEVRILAPEEVEVKLSWQEGNLIFRGESLEEALVEIGRYSMVEFIFLDETAKSVRVAGLFRAGDVDGLLSTLRENFDIAYERVDDDTVVLSAL